MVHLKWSQLKIPGQNRKVGRRLHEQALNSRLNTAGPPSNRRDTPLAESGDTLHRAMPATLKKVGMKSRQGGGAFASADKSAASAPAKKKGRPTQADAAGTRAPQNQAAAASRPPSKAPTKSPKTCPKTATGGSDGGCVWDRRRTMLLLEAVRAESSGEPTLDPAAQDDEEYLENVTSRVNGVSEEEVRALISLNDQCSPCCLLSSRKGEDFAGIILRVSRSSQ